MDEEIGFYISIFIIKQTRTTRQDECRHQHQLFRFEISKSKSFQILKLEFLELILNQSFMTSRKQKQIKIVYFNF